MLNFKVLPHQREFIEATVDTMIVGGYGSAKSHAGTLKTILRKLQYPKHKVAYYLPNYPLVKDIAFDKFPTLLEELGLSYKLNKSDKEILINNYGVIIFRSMDTPETIVGYEVAYSLIDEADILPSEKMEKVYNKILGRNRAIPNANVDAVSTPEGYRWLYEQSIKGHFKVIKAKTTDNKFLPQDYIQRLRAQYDENLLKAYLDGEFINLTSGTIFYSFKRDHNHSDEVEDGAEKLYISQDFNIGGSVSIVYVKRGKQFIAVDEYESYDTRSIIQNTIKKYPKRVIEFIPDASGNARKTSSSTTDIQMLRDAGFKVTVNSTNPNVRDRINISNNAFEKQNVMINTIRCPKLTKALEQHAYDSKGQPEKMKGAGTVDDYTDACFEENTIVIVNNKTIKIKDIPKNGLIKGYDGKNVKYINGGFKRHDNLCSIKLRNGIIIKATPDHKFLTLNGWVEAKNLQGEILCNTELYQILVRNSMEKNTPSGLISTFTKHWGKLKDKKNKRQERAYIEQFGYIIKAQFQKDMWYTIKTKINQTMKYLIWSLWNHQSIEANTQKSGTKTIQSTQEKQSKKVKINAESGTSQTKEISGTKNIMKKCRIYYIKKAFLLAQFAIKNMKQIFNTQKKINTAQTNVVRRREEIAELIMKKENVYTVKKNLQSTNIQKLKLAQEVVEVNMDKKKSKTYCVTVPKDGCFSLGNGFIVENCTYLIAKMFPIATKTTTFVKSYT